MFKKIVLEKKYLSGKQLLHMLTFNFAKAALTFI